MADRLGDPAFRINYDHSFEACCGGFLIKTLDHIQLGCAIDFRELLRYVNTEVGDDIETDGVEPYMSVRRCYT